VRFKVTYDFRRPNWVTFGHVLFVEVAKRDEAVPAACAKIAEAEPGATITRVDLRPASDHEYRRFQDLVARRERWMANTHAGIPNKRSDL
jgi:hypothetical protein